MLLYSATTTAKQYLNPTKTYIIFLRRADTKRKIKLLVQQKKQHQLIKQTKKAKNLIGYVTTLLLEYTPNSCEFCEILQDII